MRDAIAGLVRTIRPLDDLEACHRAACLAWIESGAPLWRTRPPDEPAQHLVSYFAVFDPAAGKILLVDHKKAGLWLPSGGHVEPGEHPRATVIREVGEELGIAADFLLDDPLFVTVTRTVGATAGHTDVSLWYLLRGQACGDGRADGGLRFDAEEFHGVGWFALDAVPFERADPHLRRFVQKLRASDTLAAVV